ncbi:MAG: magnesium transporter [Deltaproteobacteria bacterium]|nr:magnesium transporter [Deltaproteobacteria bacterium]
MPYLRDLLKRPVPDVHGESAGRLVEVVASGQAHAHPVVLAIGLEDDQGRRFLPIEAVDAITDQGVVLSRGRGENEAFEPSEADLHLVRDVLDRPVIATDDVRVVQVEDVEIARVNDRWYLANVAIGEDHDPERTGLGRVFQRLVRAMGPARPPTRISWSNVELLPREHAVRLKIPSRRITDLHPADLAEILSDLPRAEGDLIVSSLDVRKLADTLEEVEPEVRASILSPMPDEKVADVLEEMSPDEAADLLGELPEERSEIILHLMEQDDAADVRKLLSFPDDTAGGLMTTGYVAVRPDLSAEQVLAVLRETAHDAETIFYIYVTDDQGRLKGVISLTDLVLAQPATPILDFMHERVVTATTGESQDELAQKVAKYNLLAIPVVDEEGHLHGIVTADDALDKILPTAWKKRLPRMHR